jgi:hypothetical protein
MKESTCRVFGRTAQVSRYAGPDAPSTAATSYFRLVVRHTGYQLAPATTLGTPAKNGDAIIQSALPSHFTGAHWQLKSDGSGWYTIINRASGKCLDVAGASTQDRWPIVLFDCHGQDNQKWTLSNVDGPYQRLTPKHAVSDETNHGADIFGGFTYAGAPLVQARFHGGFNQQIQLVGAS